MTCVLNRFSLLCAMVLGLSVSVSASAYAQATLDDGMRLESEGNLAGAKAVYQSLVQQSPDSPEARFHLAQVEAWLLNVSAAQRLYEENLRQFPEHTPSQLGLAEVLSWKGRYGRALDIYDDLMTTHTDNPQVWAGLGQAQAWRGELLKSKETLTQAKEKFPENPEVVAAYLQTTRYLGKPDMTTLDAMRAVESDRLQEESDTIHELLRPTLQSVHTRHTEAGTADEKLIFNKIRSEFAFSPTADSRVMLTFEPTFYQSGRDLEHETRLSYGVGASKQWTEQVGTSGWLGLSTFTNGGDVSVLGRAAVDLRPNDHWQPTLLFNRYPVEESMLSATGLLPTVGVFANNIVGRVIRNEWTLQNSFRLPFELQGEFNPAIGVDTGNQFDDNSFWKIEYSLGRDLFKTFHPDWKSTWYTQYEGRHWHFEDDRLNNGGAFLVVKDFGLPLGSDTVSPIPSATNPGTGGYFSPDRYLFQALRLGNRGDLWNKRLLYDLSAFAGVQDISRFGTDVATGVQLTGELALSKTVSSVFGILYNNADPFNQTTAYASLRKRF